METTKKATTTAELEALRQKKISTHYKVKENFNTTVKDVDFSRRIVTGVSNTFYYFDSDQDVLISGCTDKTLAERGPDTNGAAKIKNVKDHNIQQRIGVPQVLKEDTVNGYKCQYFESKMMSSTTGNDMLIEYQEGGIDQHSIGFRYIYTGLEMVSADDANWSKWLAQLINPKDAEAYGYMFIVKEINQFEWSPVSFGANQLTPFLGVKSGNREATIMKVLERVDYLERQLKTGIQTDYTLFDHELECRQLKQVISELFENAELPSLKDTLRGRQNIQDTPGRKDSMTRICPKCLKSFTAEVGEPANCPSCGQFTPDTNMVMPFDLDKAIKSVKIF